MKRFPKLMVALVLTFALTQCAQVVPSYQVDGAGYDWKNQPIQTLPASRVIPNVRVPIPAVAGGGVVDVPVRITKVK